MRIVQGVRVTEENRFSHFVHPHDVEGMAALHKWLGWFQKDGIASVLLLMDKGYALYREGMVDLDD